MHILILGRQPNTVQSALQQVAATGHTAEGALSDTDALDKLSSERFDVLAVSGRIEPEAQHLIDWCHEHQPQTDVWELAGADILAERLARH